MAQFFVWGRKQSNGRWKVSSFSDDHSCDEVDPSDRNQRTRGYRGKVVLAATPEFASMYESSGRGGDTRSLRKSISKGGTGLSMGPSVANRLVHDKQQDTVMHLIWDYAHVPEFIAAAKLADPSGYYEYEPVVLREPGIECLKRVIWINGSVVAGFTQLGDFLGFFIVDGAHLKTPFGGCLLQLVGLDANHHLVPIARAIVPVENAENVAWMMEHVLKALPKDALQIGLGDEGSAFMSSIFQDLLKEHHIIWTLCTNHVADNLKGKGMRELVYRVGEARTEEFVVNAISEIRKVNEESARIVEEKVQMIAPYHVGLPRGGVHVNSPVESANNMVNDERHCGPCECIYGTLSEDAQRSVTHLANARSCKTILTPHWHEYALKQHAASFKYSVTMSVCSKVCLVGTVTHQTKRTSRQVSITWNEDTGCYETICECSHFEEYAIPCCHAYCLLRAGHEKLGKREYFWDMKALYGASVLTSSWVRQHSVPGVMIPRPAGIPEGVSARKAVFGLLAEKEREMEEGGAQGTAIDFPKLPLYPMQFVPRAGRPKSNLRTAKKFRRIVKPSEKHKGKRGSVEKIEDGSAESDEDEEEVAVPVSSKSKTITCSHCGASGHNSQTCPKPDTIFILQKLGVLPSSLARAEIQEDDDPYMIGAPDEVLPREEKRPYAIRGKLSIAPPTPPRFDDYDE